MDRTQSPPTLPRLAVLIVNYPDGYAEAFADRNVDVHFARVPVYQTRRGEQLADDILELSLPHRHRQLYRRDRLRGNATTRPLTPQVAATALSTRSACNALSDLGAEVQEGAIVWTL